MKKKSEKKLSISLSIFKLKLCLVVVTKDWRVIEREREREGERGKRWENKMFKWNEMKFLLKIKHKIIVTLFLATPSQNATEETCQRQLH